MAVQAPHSELALLYREDYAAWARETAARLRARDFDGLDTESAAEELEALAGKDERELLRRLTILIQHLLKWEYQPEYRSKSWLATIRVQRKDIGKLLRDSPSLRRRIAPNLEELFAEGREEAIFEGGLLLERIPVGALYSEDQILSSDWLPGHTA